MENNFNIKKSDGRTEKYNPDKYHDRLFLAAEGLKVSVSDVEMSASASILDGTTSHEIQKALIKSCADKISEDEPDYEIMAARLLMQDLRKKVYGKWMPLPFLDMIKKNIKAGNYDKYIFEKYSQEELEYFGSRIKYNRDDSFVYSGLKKLKDSYLLKKNGKLQETPQEMFMMINLFAFAKYSKKERRRWVVEGYNILSKFEASLPTPIMIQLRTVFKRFISCNLIPSGDTKETLANTAKTILELVAAGAGLGIGNQVRGLGADIGDGRLTHTGLLPIFKGYEKNTKSFVQPSRDGCHFKDTEVEILESFEIDGVVYKATKENISKYSKIKFNYKKIKIQDVKLGDFIKSFDIENNLIEPQEVSELIRPIVEKENQLKIVTETGYIINSTKHPMLVFSNGKYEYKASIDIIVGDILLNDSGKHIKVIDLVKPNLDTQFYDLTVENNNNFFAGYEDLYCGHNSSTVYHPFFHPEIESILPIGNAKGTEETRIRDMDHSIIFNDTFFERYYNDKDITLFYLNDVPNLLQYIGKPEFKEMYEGFEKTVPKKNQKRIKARKLFDKFLDERFLQSREYMMDASNVNNQGMYIIPITMSNLCLVGETKVQTKGEIKFLKDIKVGDSVLSKNIETNKIEFKKVLDWGMTSPSAEIIKITIFNGSNIECTPDHKVFTSNRGYIQAKNIKKDDVLDFNGFETKITLIENLKNEKVYDITVEDNHNFYANDILVHNCAEITQPVFPITGISIKRNIKFESDEDRNKYYELRTKAYFYQNDSEKELKDIKEEMTQFYEFSYDSLSAPVDEWDDYDYFDIDGTVNLSEVGVCILAGINMGHCIEERLPIVSEYLVRFLEELIDYQDYDLPEVEKAAKMRRPLGIGFSDIFHMMAINEKFYNTRAGRQLLHDRVELSIYHMTKTSIQLAKERGTCLLYKDTKYSQGLFTFDTYSKNVDELVKHDRQKLDWEGLRVELKKWGMRHSSLGANAPYGSCMNFEQKIQTKEEGNLNFNDILKREEIDFKNLKVGWHDLKEEIKVPTKDGDSIATRFRYNGVATTYEIEFENGTKGRFTGNHKLWCLRKDEYQWIRVDELNENDEIMEIK